MTASTGMAALQFKDGMTVNHWCGLGGGHMDINKLVEQILISLAYSYVCKNIMECESLIIDEIGMISATTLEYVELICRSVKGNNLLFGGIQIIAAGSFVQLPPVPNV